MKVAENGGDAANSGGGIREWWNNIDWTELSYQADDFFIVASMADAQLPIGDAVGAMAVGGARLGKLLFAARNFYKFGGDDAVKHFYKHGSSVMKALGKSSYGIANYIDDANYVIQNGTFVPELNGYVRLIGGQGSAKFGFVGLNRATGNITTFHLKTAEWLSKNAPSLGIGY